MRVYYSNIVLNNVDVYVAMICLCQDGEVVTPDHRDININIVKDNVRIIDSHRNWNVLLYKEAIKIKELKALLNIGLKASKESDLF